MRQQCSLYRPRQRNRSFSRGIRQLSFVHQQEDDVTCALSDVEGAGGEELSPTALPLQKSARGQLSPATGMYFQALCFSCVTSVPWHTAAGIGKLLSRMVSWKSIGRWPPPGPSMAPYILSQLSFCKRTSVSQQSPGSTCLVHGFSTSSKHVWLSSTTSVVVGSHRHLMRWEKERPSCQSPVLKAPGPGSWEDHEYSSKHQKRQLKTLACSTAPSAEAKTITCPGGSLILQLQPEEGKRLWYK